MEPIDIGLIVTGFLLVLVVLGVRVAFAAAIAGLVGLIWIFWAKRGYDPEQFLWALTVAVKTAGQVPHSKISSQALSLIPTFILIGFLAYYAGLTKALFEAAKRWVGWLPGGLAVSTVFATAGFAAVSGASVATAAVFARIAIPEMIAIGYDKRFAAGGRGRSRNPRVADPPLRRSSSSTQSSSNRMSARCCWPGFCRGPSPQSCMVGWSSAWRCFSKASARPAAASPGGSALSPSRPYSRSCS